MANDASRSFPGGLSSGRSGFEVMNAGCRFPLVAVAVFALCVAGMLPAAAEKFTINTPGGSFEVEISHLGPSGSLVAPGAPQGAPFRPPAIFSAPLPTGSGARALGFAGCFTAIADDATAASWNPAGLIQLERPEASFVARYSRHDFKHRSQSADFKTGDDTFSNYNLNYVSAVYPFNAGDRNCVFSINFQEAYDFEHRFTADVLGASAGTASDSASKTYNKVETKHFEDEDVSIDLVSHIRTRVDSSLSQVLNSDLVSGLEFEQHGVIDAITPALAFEITPRICAGLSVNFYADNTTGGNAIRSRISAAYGGTSASAVTVTDRRITSGTYEYTGAWHVPPIEVMPGVTIPGRDIPISGAGEYPPFSDREQSEKSEAVVYDGLYTENNTFDYMEGVNLTAGLLVFVSRRLSVGLSVDLPWTAEAVQTKTIKNRIVTSDEARTRELDVSESAATETRKMELRFPMYCAAGAVWRWNNVLSSCFDVSQTRWSQFRFRSGDDEPLNPLDGSVYGENPIDDCWSVKYGMEYLLVLSKTEIPFRAGVTWEQRPAVGKPDQFWGYSVGSGISVGRDPGRLILDVAYSYSRGKDVFKSLVPDQQGLTTDSVEHQVYFSGIWHF